MSLIFLPSNLNAFSPPYLSLWFSLFMQINPDFTSKEYNPAKLQICLLLCSEEIAFRERHRESQSQLREMELHYYCFSINFATSQQKGSNFRQHGNEAACIFFSFFLARGMWNILRKPLHFPSFPSSKSKSSSGSLCAGKSSLWFPLLAIIAVK